MGRLCSVGKDWGVLKTRSDIIMSTADSLIAKEGNIFLLGKALSHAGQLLSSLLSMNGLKVRFLQRTESYFPMKNPKVFALIESLKLMVPMGS